MTEEELLKEIQERHEKIQPTFVEMDGEQIGCCNKHCPSFNRTDRYPREIRCEMMGLYNTGLYLIVCMPWLTSFVKRARIIGEKLMRKS